MIEEFVPNDSPEWKLHRQWKEFLRMRKCRFSSLYSCKTAVVDPTRKMHAVAVKQMADFAVFCAFKRLTS